MLNAAHMSSLKGQVAHCIWRLYIYGSYMLHHCSALQEFNLSCVRKKCVHWPACRPGLLRL